MLLTSLFTLKESHLGLPCNPLWSDVIYEQSLSLNEARDLLISQISATESYFIKTEAVLDTQHQTRRVLPKLFTQILLFIGAGAAYFIFYDHQLQFHGYSGTVKMKTWMILLTSTLEQWSAFSTDLVKTVPLPYQTSCWQNLELTRQSLQFFTWIIRK